LRFGRTVVNCWLEVFAKRSPEKSIIISIWRGLA